VEPILIGFEFEKLIPSDPSYLPSI